MHRTKLLRYKRVGSSVRDPIRRAGGLSLPSFLARPIAERRELLRRALERKKPSDDFFCAVRDPKLSRAALLGGLDALERGDVRWAFLANPEFAIRTAGRRLPTGRVKSAVLAVARTCTARERIDLAVALSRVGGREARSFVEEIFARVRSARARSHDDHERLYDAAAALLQLAPERVDAAAILIAGLKRHDRIDRSSAARAVSRIEAQRGAGGELLRARLRTALRRPDPVIFFVFERALLEISRSQFLRACVRLLGSNTGEFAAGRLVRRGGPRERAKALAWLRGKRSFDAHITVVSALGARAPKDLLLRTLDRGLHRPSPFERERTIWLLDSCSLPQTASIAREALEREPDADLRARLEKILRKHPKGSSARLRSASARTNSSRRR